MPRERPKEIAKTTTTRQKTKKKKKKKDLAKRERLYADAEFLESLHGSLNT